MDKNAIKKYAIWARRELIARVSQKALQYGISESDCGDPNADSIDGRVLTKAEKQQRQTLIRKIKAEGYQQVMEEVAYTWFNRFIALRFMEVNGYLPSHVRVFTDDQGNFKPQILTEAINLDLDGLDMEKVYALKDANKTEELYKYLLIVQCNALNPILPGMFQRISDYTELLFPDNLLREGSVIEQMVSMIPEDDWTDQVQIIGWLYQYYNTEPKDQVFADLKKNIKITKEKIPAATQLFTPDWIVRYMVENSLGRLWLEGHPAAGEKLLPLRNEDGSVRKEEGRWNYYLEEAEQEPEVQAQLAEIRKTYAALTPEEIRVIDPCMGSGHILAYMFDVLMQIYEDYGYARKDAVCSIIRNNLWGLDVDDRAAQLAYFAVMMKARQYDRRFFSRGLQPHVYAIAESNNAHPAVVDYFCNGDAELALSMQTIIGELHDAKEYGSILSTTRQNWDALYARFDEIADDVSSIYRIPALDFLPLVQTAEALSIKYSVSITNPPYMDLTNASPKLKELQFTLFPGCGDLYAVFIERCRRFVSGNGMFAMITMHGWLFSSSLEMLRLSILNNNTICNLLHLGSHAFDNDVGTIVQSASFVIRGYNITSYNGSYYNLTAGLNAPAKEAAFFNTTACTRQQDSFFRVKGFPMSYWATQHVVESFATCAAISDSISLKAGLSTGNNELFCRYWHEVEYARIKFNCTSTEETIHNGYKWYPCNSGGEYRKWITCNRIIVNWEHDGQEIREYRNSKGNIGSAPRNSDYYFKEGMTWNKISSKFTMMYKAPGFIFDDTSRSGFVSDNRFLYYYIGFLSSSVANIFLKAMNHTFCFTNNEILRLPFRLDESKLHEITEMVKTNISLSTADWNYYESSWGFGRHPLVVSPRERSDQLTLYFNSQARRDSVSLLRARYDIWQHDCESRFVQLQDNEESLNQTFIEIYRLQGELSPDVEDADVTVRRADLERDIRSLISYAVGCMFGRYSIYKEGLIYAGGEWDYNKYEDFAWIDEGRPDPIQFHSGTHFFPDQDNIIPITDDEYFHDDIVNRFMEFLCVVYGSDTLEENLKFIADALGGKGSPREVIRNYFLNDFYADHLKVYQKRPIYWLFDSGKKNGFKCLIYMHRYQPDTIARIRTDYVHEQQARYRTAIDELERRISDAATAERVKLNKQLFKLQAQADELRDYEEKIHHLADQMISIDLDDGVKANYAKFQDVLAKIK